MVFIVFITRPPLVWYDCLTSYRVPLNPVDGANTRVYSPESSVSDLCLAGTFDYSRSLMD